MLRRRRWRALFATRIKLAPLRDPEFKGLVEWNNQFRGPRSCPIARVLTKMPECVRMSAQVFEPGPVPRRS